MPVMGFRWHPCRHWQRRVEFLTYAARRAGGAIDDLYMRDDANLADPMDEIMRHVIPYPGRRIWRHLMRMYAYTTARSMIFAHQTLSGHSEHAE